MEQVAKILGTAQETQELGLKFSLQQEGLFGKEWGWQGDGVGSHNMGRIISVSDLLAPFLVREWSKYPLSFDPLSGPSPISFKKHTPKNSAFLSFM